MGEWKSRLYHGRVMHARFKPKKHLLKYQVCSFLFDLDELEELDRRLSFFSLNRWNLLSFHNKDFGDGKKTGLRDYVIKTLKKSNIDIDDGRIELLCYPRMFGYVFNPLSVYFCYDPSNKLKAIIYEVTNTFKQRHSYVIEVDQDADSTIKHSCQKEFYVSPFIDMDVVYNFSILQPGEKVTIGISQHDHEGSLLKAIFTGKAAPMSNMACLKMLLRYPLMTLKIIAGIHWEALHLWRKGVKLVERPEPPVNAITPITYQNQKERFGND